MNLSPVLRTNQLAIGYTHPPRIIRDHLELALYPGELVCLIGPNGAGKSTLLRTLAGMQPPISGEVLLQGANLHRISARERARLLAIVLTERVDPGLLTGYGLVALGRHPYTDWTGQITPDDEAHIREAVHMVGAEALAQRRFAELSDGEQQKLLIARALAQEPAVMLLDEPTAYLDLPRRVEVLALLRDLARRSGRAVLLSTHDLDLALRSADRIWLMPSQGAVVSGTPEDLVLDGSFADAFGAEGVHFDAESGSFRIRAVSRAGFALEGDGLRRTWTVRALERAGFAVDPDSQQRILIEPEAWLLQTDAGTSRYTSLHDLLHAVRSEIIS